MPACTISKWLNWVSANFFSKRNIFVLFSSRPAFAPSFRSFLAAGFPRQSGLFSGAAGTCFSNRFRWLMKDSGDEPIALTAAESPQPPRAVRTCSVRQDGRWRVFDDALRALFTWPISSLYATYSNTMNMPRKGILYLTNEWTSPASPFVCEHCLRLFEIRRYSTHIGAIEHA